MAVNYELRYASHPEDFKSYDTERINKEYLVSNLFEEGNINLVYSLYDRFITGGAKPGKSSLKLETIEPLKSEFFLQRRELGIINVGKNNGIVTLDGEDVELSYKEALYVGSGVKEVTFKGDTNFYLNSTPAHTSYPNKKVTAKEAEIVELGALETANHRVINKLIVNSVVKTCQLQMGMTELKKGSVWNTMPAHTHNRRMEVYFYFDLPEDQALLHLMGEPKETRHLWMKNNEAVISPSWSIHSGAGTSNYIFIWGMAGENLDYGDMNISEIKDLK
ncbi:MAG: 5-dehydro-4-deoxy-D-glucuronate isomerase [Bacteroidota bacterium]